jgi:tetratricopeptide (TPR) repeat protein
VRRPLLALAFALGCSADRAARQGREALDAHRLADAEAAFRRALAAEPDHAVALAGLGWTYQVAGRRDAAGEVFDRCLALHPAAVDCLRGRGSVALSAGNLQEARRRLEEARALAPEDPAVLTSLGVLQSASGELAAAEATWQTLVARHPERAEAHAGLADLRTRQGRWEEALAAIDLGLATAAAEGSAARHRAVLLLLRARVLVAQTADRVDPARCAETAPPVLAWLDEAARASADARSEGVDAAELGQVERLIQRRRAAIAEQCPAGAPAAPADPPAADPGGK